MVVVLNYGGIKKAKELYYELKDWSALTYSIAMEAKTTPDLTKKAKCYRELSRIAIEHQKDYAKAREWLNKLLTIAPFDTEGLKSLELVLNEQQQWQDLDVVLLKRALQADGSQMMDIYYKLFYNYARNLNLPNKAYDVFKKIIQLDPAHPYVGSIMAWLEKFPQRRRDALKALKEIFDRERK